MLADLLGPLVAAILALALAAAGVLLIRLERRRQGELRTLAALAQAIAGAPEDASEVAEAAYIHTARLLPADFFQLGVFEGEAYRTLIWIRDGNRIRNREFTLEADREGLVGWIRRTGESLLVPDFRRSASLPAAPSYASDDPPASGLFVPLIAETAVIGVIAVQSRRRNAFGRREEVLLRALAGSVATALAAMSWRGEARARERQIALLEDVARLLTPLRPLAAALPEVTGQIAARLDTTTVAVFEVEERRLVPLASTSSRAEAGFAAREDVQSFAQRAVTSMALVSQVQDQDAPSSHPAWECACPLRVQDRVLGVLYLSRRSGPFLRADRRLVELVASQLALAFLEAANFGQQQEEAWFTTVLLEIAKHAAQPGDPDLALQAVLQLTTLLAGASWALLLMADATGTRLRTGPNAGLRKSVLDRLADLVLSPDDFAILDSGESETPQPLALPEPLATAIGSREAMASILSDGRHLLGLLLVQAGAVEGRRTSLLTGIAHQISLRLENTVLVEEATLRRSLERELQTARAIQESFLPLAPPEHPGWRVGAFWRAAHRVGGDFYDFIPLPPGAGGPRWGLVIADVADKGVPAALYMALTRTLLRTVAPADDRPGATLARLNHLLLNETSSDMFVSIWYGIWEPERGRVTYANAGHVPPLLFRPGARGTLLPHGQTVLGVLPDVVYAEGTLEIPLGSLLLMYTDGVSEAAEGSELFGLHRIEATVLGLSSWDPPAVLALLGDRVAAFSGHADPADDLTIVCLHRPQAPSD
jgi:serine phosphatase RsbU (regulator of sigma subunit)/putative methionine-R-sulfoxide reductase with GAF domain